MGIGSVVGELKISYPITVSGVGGAVEIVVLVPKGG